MMFLRSNETNASCLERATHSCMPCCYTCNSRRTTTFSRSLFRPPPSKLQSASVGIIPAHTPTGREMPSFLNKFIHLGRKRDSDSMPCNFLFLLCALTRSSVNSLILTEDDLKPAKLGSTEMRSGPSAPSPTSPKFFDDPYLDASNGGSRTLGARRPKSEDALRNVSIAQFFKSASPPTSPRSPTTSFAPKLDIALPISSSIPRSEDAGGKGVDEKNAVVDEFGALLLGPDADRFTMLSDEDIATTSLTPKEVITLVQAASAVIHAQGATPI